ncbi:MAG: hypothetical protein ACOZCO_12430 [Bacteroidota bacterium]
MKMVLLYMPGNVLKKFKIPGMLVLLSLVQMFFAFVNGYPVVYSDTSTYIESGFTFETPFDRPVTYGLFLWIASFNGVSLWLVIFFQSMVLSWLILLYFKKFVDRENYFSLSFFALLAVSLFSCLSWTSSQLMPDVFTSVLLFATVLLVLSETTVKEKIILNIIILFSCAMHFSHVMFLFFLLCSIASIKIFSKKQQVIKASWSIIVTVFLMAVISTITMGSAFSKSRHVFLMGAMTEHGITKEYLDEFCPEKNYRLCTYKDSLPEKAWEFIWKKNSPLYVYGGWSDSKEEFNEIITATLTRPKYLWLHLKASCTATLQQLIMFRMGDGNGAFLKETELYTRVEKYFPQEIISYRESKQNRNELSFLPVFNFINIFLVGVSCLIILLLLLIKKELRKTFHPLLLLFMVGITLNAWVCGTFANAIDRLGSKMMWIIPFMAFTAVYLIIFKKGKMPEIQ